VLLLFVVAFLFTVSLRNFESLRQKSQALLASPPPGDRIASSDE